MVWEVGLRGDLGKFNEWMYPANITLDPVPDSGEIPDSGCPGVPFCHASGQGFGFASEFPSPLSHG